MIGNKSERQSKQCTAVPAKAGIKVWCVANIFKLDSRLRGNGAVVGI
jgi:hypothetical protein